MAKSSIGISLILAVFPDPSGSLGSTNTVSEGDLAFRLADGSTNHRSGHKFKVIPFLERDVIQMDISGCLDTVTTYPVNHVSDIGFGTEGSIIGLVVYFLGHVLCSGVLGHNSLLIHYGSIIHELEEKSSIDWLYRIGPL